MPESEPGLSRDAFCYAGGVLGESAARAFEQRLGEDQAAREALADAVGRVQALAGAPPLAPDPGYRAAVLRRLGGGGGLWHRLTGPRRYPGHPALWALTGAAAAALLLTLLPLRSRGILPAAPTLGTAAATDESPAAVDFAGPSLCPPEVAEVWATLQNYRHLAQAHEEVARRRGRPEPRPPAAADVLPGSPPEFPQVMD